MGKTDVLVTTEPGGGEIKVDGVARGVTPLTVRGAAARPSRCDPRQRDGCYDARRDHAGRHRRQRASCTWRSCARRRACWSCSGDLPAQIYVDGTLVVENVQKLGATVAAAGQPRCA